MVPKAVLMKSGLVSINTARQVNTAHSKTTVNAARPMSYLSKIAYLTVKRLIHKNSAFKNSNINQRVNTIRGKEVNTARPKAVVNAVKGNNVNVVKASTCWVWKLMTKVLDHVSKHNSASITLKKFDYIDAQGNPRNPGVIDMDAQRHMTGNHVLATDYEEIDGEKSTKDETSGILKSFITEIENIVDHKVKVIRCDNGTEFKNREMNQFCEMKGTQSNDFTGTKASDNAGQARKETAPVKDYILLQLWTADSSFSQNPKSSYDDESKPSSDDGKKVDEDPRKDSEYKDQEKEDNVRHHQQCFNY
ncbi:putative ribonuclease H-like domain-containing protein [Tanacetum coccineum]